MSIFDQLAKIVAVLIQNDSFFVSDWVIVHVNLRVHKTMSEFRSAAEISLMSFTLWVPFLLGTRGTYRRPPQKPSPDCCNELQNVATNPGPEHRVSKG